LTFFLKSILLSLIYLLIPSIMPDRYRYAALPLPPFPATPSFGETGSFRANPVPVELLEYPYGDRGAGSVVSWLESFGDGEEYPPEEEVKAESAVPLVGPVAPFTKIERAFIAQVMALHPSKRAGFIESFYISHKNDEYPQDRERAAVVLESFHDGRDHSNLDRFVASLLNISFPDYIKAKLGRLQANTAMEIRAVLGELFQEGGEAANAHRDLEEIYDKLDVERSRNVTFS
jgi:hypothetical protein